MGGLQDGWGLLGGSMCWCWLVACLGLWWDWGLPLTGLLGASLDAPVDAALRGSLLQHSMTVGPCRSLVQLQRACNVTGLPMALVARGLLHDRGPLDRRFACSA